MSSSKHVAISRFEVIPLIIIFKPARKHMGIIRLKVIPLT